MIPSWEPLANYSPRSLHLRWATQEEIAARGHGVVTRAETVDSAGNLVSGGVFDEAIFGFPPFEGDPKARLSLAFKHELDEQAPLSPLSCRFGVIELPARVLHPLSRTRFGGALEAATGWTGSELLALLEDRAAYDPGSGAIVEEMPEGVSGADAIGLRLASLGQAEDLLIRSVLVLPVYFRPIVPTPSGRLAFSEVNDLYRRVINRVGRVARLLELKAPNVLVRQEKLLLQRAVDSLFDNGLLPAEVQVRAPHKRLDSLMDLVDPEALGEVDAMHLQASPGSQLDLARCTRRQQGAVRALEAMMMTITVASAQR